MPLHVVLRETSKIALGAKMRSLFVVKSQLVLPQFARSPKRLAARVAFVASEPGVERLVFFQTVAPRRAERAEATFVWLCAVVFESCPLQ